MKSKLFIGSLMLVLVCFVLVANGIAAPNTNQVVIGMTQEPDSLNWITSDMSATTQVLDLFVSDLIRRDGDWKLYPEIATTVPTLENGLWKVMGDKMEVTYKLRRGLRWADGVEITSEDVKYTWQVLMNDEIGVPSREISERIEEVQIVDKYTVKFKFKEIYHLANLGLDYQILPKHIVEPLLKKGARSFMESDFSKKPTANGPYVLKEWAQGSHMVFEASPKYNLGKKPKIKTVIFRFIPNTNTLLANLLAGSVDLLAPVGITLDQGLALEKMIEDQKRAKDYEVQFTDALVWEHVDFQLDHPWFKDKRVRQALTHALDREGMVKALFNGKQKVSHSYLPPKHYGYNPNVKKYDYNIEKAKALLAEAGWKMGPKGILVNDKGEEFIVSINTTAGNAVREKVEQIMKSQWKQIGVELKIENVPSTVLFGEVTPKRQFQLAMYAWVSPPTTNPYGLWHSSQIPTEANAWSGQNRPGWRNAKSDQLSDDILKTLNEKDRIKLMGEHQALWAEELPSIPLYFRVDVSASHKNLKGIQPTGNTTPITWNVNVWSWVK